jgi:hypothetical protein
MPWNQKKKEYSERYRKEGRRKKYDEKYNADYFQKHKEKSVKKSTKYADDRPLYRTWYSMKTRCLNEKHEAYPNYGGRGIKVCDRWMKFENFEEDINKLIGPRPEGMTLDRVNNDGDYAPGNVRWATRIEQRANRRKEVI